MIASDLHGSAFYTEQLIAAFQREEADRLLLLGDLLYHGPRNDLPRDYNPKRVVGMLNKICDRIVAVRGNCEAQVDQAVLQFPVLADYCLLSGRQHLIFATHGHVYNMDCLPPMQPGDILLHGHTHIPVLEETEVCIYMNPGSVSIPKNNSHHGYMLWQEADFIWKELETGAEMKRYLYDGF